MNSETVRKHTFFEELRKCWKLNEIQKCIFARFVQRVSEEAEEVRDEQNACWQGRNDGCGGREMESEYQKI
jgi:hypothetical protein